MRRLDPLMTPLEGLALCEGLYRDGEGLHLMRHLLPAGASDAEVLQLRNQLKREQRRFSKCMAQQDALERT